MHAHPPYAVAASLVSDEIRPLDSEGIMFCPLIPVIAGVPGTQRLADAVAGMMQHHKLVIAQGHGTFAGGATLDEAFHSPPLPNMPAGSLHSGRCSAKTWQVTGFF